MKQIAMTIIGALLIIGGLQATAIKAADQQGVSSGQMPTEQAESSTSQRRGPPPEAYSACEGKSAGATAELTTRRGETLTGTCEEDRDGKLVLRPERSGNNDNNSSSSNDSRRGPPPEAYTACEGKSSGASAQLTTPRGEILTGSCEEDRDGKLVLRPDQPRDIRGGGQDQQQQN